MNTTEEQITKKKRIVPKGRVRIVVQREYIGARQIAEAMLPIMFEDIKRKNQTPVLAHSTACAE